MYLCLYIFGLVLQQYVNGVEELYGNPDHDDVSSKNNTELVKEVQEVYINLDDDDEISSKNNTNIEISEIEEVYTNSDVDDENSFENNTETEVIGDQEVYKDSNNDDEILSKNNTEIEESLSDVNKEQAEVDSSMEFTSSPKDDGYLPTELTSDVLDGIETMEEVVRISRALGLEFDPTYYAYRPVLTNTYQQYAIIDDFNSFTQPNSKPIKQIIPAKGKVTIIGSFKDFNWNIPTTTINDDEILNYNDNIPIENRMYNDVYLPNAPFYYTFNRRPLPNVPFSKNEYLQNEPHYNDNIKIGADEIIRKKIPVKGKLTIAATFGNCGFM